MSIQDIGKNFLKSKSIAFQKQAVDQLSGAIEDFGGPTLRQAYDATRQGSGSLGSNILKGILNSAENEAGKLQFQSFGENAAQTRDYAQDLSENHNPKMKFLFVVNFEFNPDYAHMFGKHGDTRAHSFLVKSIDRPKFNFEYEEINMYNYRTKVLKTIRPEALNMIFWDDTGNKVASLMSDYHKALSPLARMTADVRDSKALESKGMNFGPDEALRNVAANSTSTRRSSIFKSISVDQIYLAGNMKTLSEGARYFVNRFYMINPRIESFDFDDLSHEGNDASTISVAFSYDAVSIDTGILVSKTDEQNWDARSEMMKNLHPNQDSRGAGSSNVKSSAIDKLFGDTSKSIGGIINDAKNVMSGKKGLSQLTSVKDLIGNVGNTGKTLMGGVAGFGDSVKSFFK